MGDFLGSVFDAALNTFYWDLKVFFVYDNLFGVREGWLIFSLILKVIFSIIIISYARSKDLSGLLTLFLCITVPPAGAFFIVALLPEGYAIGKPVIAPQKKEVPQIECERCRKLIDSDYSACPHCGAKVNK